MNAPTRHPIASKMFGDALIADASKVTPQEFLAVATERMFPTSRIAERYAATWRYCDALGKCDDHAAVKAAYERELAEIDERYGLTEVRAVKHLGKTGVGA